MEGFFANLTGAAFAELGGWMTCVTLIIGFGFALSRGYIKTSGQVREQNVTVEAAHQKALEAKDVIIAGMKEQFEKRLAEYEEHYDALLALKREGYDTAYASLKETYEARLAERSEVLAEARDNLREMIEIARSYGVQLSAIARQGQTTEALLTALDTALGLTSSEARSGN